MELLLVRHGQSQADLEERHEGRADFPLTDLGREQAHQAAKWINKHYIPSVIISSPLIRAAETASIISTKTHVDIEYDDQLMEWNNGLLAGMLKSEAAHKYPLPPGGRKPHDEHYNCESMIDFRARIEKFWSEIRHSDWFDENNRICIVAHGGTISMLMRSILNLPMQTNVNFVTGDTGMHLINIDGKSKVVLFANSLKHLNKKT